MRPVRVLSLLSLAALGCAAGNQPIIFDDFDTGVLPDDVVVKEDITSQPEVLTFDIPPLDAGVVDTGGGTDVTAPLDTGSGEAGIVVDVPAVDTGPRADVCRIVCGTVCVDTETDTRHFGRCGNDCTALPAVDAPRATCEPGGCNLPRPCVDGPTT